MHTFKWTRNTSWALFLFAALAALVTVNLMRSVAPAEAAETRSVVVVGLWEQNGSGQSGVAVLSSKVAKTEVTINVSSGAKGVAQPIHIHTGPCSTLGGVVHALKDVVDGKSTTTVDAKLEDLLAGGLSINLHKSVAEIATYTACGDIPARDDLLTFDIAGVKDSKQTGYATLVAGGDKTWVNVSVTPGAGTAAQPAHLHTGGCTAPGPVVHALSNIVSGRSISIVERSLAGIQGSELSLNIHKSEREITVYTACGRTPAAKPAAAKNLVLVPLSELSSGQSGVAVLTAKGKNKTEVVISVNSVIGAPQPIHIHKGTCDTLGGVAHVLNSVERGWSKTTVDARLASLQSGGFAINLQKSVLETGVYMACGDIPMASNATTISMTPSGKWGQRGYASLIGSGDATWVAVWVGAGGAEQPIHIHDGTCGKLGGVAHALNNVVNGVSVTNVAASLASLRTGKFAINLHKSAAEIAEYTSCGGISAAPAAKPTTVKETKSEIKGSKLLDVSVTVGTKVTWTNMDAVFHTVTGDTGGWMSDALTNGASYSNTFNTKGTFNYHCAFHPETMKAKVTVR
jgi:plastocyanin